MRLLKTILLVSLILIPQLALGQVEISRTKGEDTRVTFTIRDATDGTLISSAAGLDSEYSHGSNDHSSGDMSTFTDCTNEASEIATSSGIYELEVEASEMDDDLIVLKITSTTSDAVPAVILINTIDKQSLDELTDADGTATGAGSNYLDLANDASTIDDYYGADDYSNALVIVSGTGAGQSRCISDYTGSTRRATVNTAWITTPDTTSEYIIVADPGCSLATAGSGGSSTCTSISAGAITSSSFAAGAISSTALATDTITADKIAGDAIGASEIAADAIGNSEIATDAIGATEIAADAIGASEIAASAIGASELATDAIGADELASDAIGVTEISTAGANRLSDITLRRSTSNIESSSYGDTLSYKSLYGAIASQTHRYQFSGGNAIVYKSDGSTSLNTRAATSDSSAAAITELAN